MKKSVVSTLVLVCICAVMAILLAVTNMITAPIIQEKMEQAANAALKEIMPDGEGFEKMDISTYTLPSTVTEVYKEANGGYVVTDEDGFLQLTESGLESARITYERHRLLTEFFVRLGVSPEIASEDACKIEHHISAESFEALKRHVAQYDK